MNAGDFNPVLVTHSYHEDLSEMSSIFVEEEDRSCSGAIYGRR